MKIGKIIRKLHDDVRVIKRKSCKQIEEIIQGIFPEYKIEVEDYDQTRVRFIHKNGSDIDFILYATYDNDITPQSMPRMTPRPKYRPWETVKFPENEIKDIKIKLNKLYE